jgi:hypothetical protein
VRYFKVLFCVNLMDQGEAILMIARNNASEKRIADILLTADVDPMRSQLHVATGKYVNS